jgi:hypothetical protein
MRLKPWQKREFRKENNEDNLRWMIRKGLAKTEDEACSLLKNKWKTATREINSNGYWSYYFVARRNPSFVVNSS